MLSTVVAVALSVQQVVMPSNIDYSEQEKMLASSAYAQRVQFHISSKTLLASRPYRIQRARNIKRGGRGSRSHAVRR